MNNHNELTFPKSELTFPESAYAESIRIRWFTENCYEIRLSNGKTIVIDPCLPAKDEPYAERYYSGYTPDDLEGCDYVIINHTHRDHVYSIDKVVDRFNPRILVNANSALQLAKVYQHKDLFKFFPLHYGQDYDFGDFRLHTYPGQHVDSSGWITRPPIDTDENVLYNLGSLFNMNYLITTQNNFRIAFDGGVHMASINDWYNAAPNLYIRQLDWPEFHDGYEGAFQNMADSLERSGAQYMSVTVVQNLTGAGAARRGQKPMELYEYSNAINELMKEKGSQGRMFNFKAGKWYTVRTQILREE